MVAKTNVFEYVDYRLFMKAFYENKKSHPGPSPLGASVSSPTTLRLIS